MSNPTVLVVEDERDILDLVEFNLAQAGYKVLTAMDGTSGLNTAIRERPDLLVLDLMLPGMDGKEVCRRLKQNQSTVNTPVLILNRPGQRNRPGDRLRDRRRRLPYQALQPQRAGAEGARHPAPLFRNRGIGRPAQAGRDRGGTRSGTSSRPAARR